MMDSHNMRKQWFHLSIFGVCKKEKMLAEPVKHFMSYKMIYLVVLYRIQTAAKNH